MELRLSNKRDCARWSLLGILLLILGLLILILDPAAFLIRVLLKMKEGSMAHNLWKKPPVEIYLDIYLFNITNAERFMKGQDSKLAFEEIGPYVFKETRENSNMTYNENGTMTFVPNVTIVHVPELSVGDMKIDRIICINIPLMGIFSNNGNASIFKQLGLNLFAKTIDAKAVLNLTVEELMWGYDDQLIRLASGYYPEWIPFDRFGIIDRMYADTDDVITIDLNESKSKLYTIEKWNGVSGLGVWGYTDENSSLPCNTFKGAYEGLLFPTNLAEGSNVDIYKKIFCRKLRLYHKKIVMMDSGLLGYSYELPYSALSCSNPENVCYCPDKGPCLPDGFSDVSPCYYGLPVAISFPHFLGANETLAEKFHGISPNESKHSSTIIIQPNIGMPMKVTSKIQLNLVVRNMKFNNQLKPFSNMIIPILWMDARVEKLPRDLELKVLLVFKYLPYIQNTISWFLITIGLILFVYKTIMYLFVSIKAAQAKNQPSLTYIPVSTNEPFENKKEKEVITYD